MSFTEFKTMRETVRRLLATRTYVSYSALVEAVRGTFECTYEEAVYAVRGLVEEHRG